MAEYDPYPKFSNEAKAWFMAMIEGMVSKPDQANFARIKGGNDLEVAIVVDPEDEHVFTEEVCGALRVLLAQVTKTCWPVVYLKNTPHPQAEESIRMARS
ncbi:hypothetical protein COT97_04360 [Candidatus Falkowbacteria bacterium CG10_big_fil_rev_8_21_14_0_10_39_11]|uniref:Uncharacterized protein n=1 Tax=Candidatus Falkowbacteria bacterium CG10_big_fil_rev_8_21_14_0_10_39_11 TaxID=1974565 RepID=A0A2H0V477_9BACT|nr:MAG: hypothetical protein COT97_04360 [Candidatus Falkowbacteria bacterium CG10_big_fil_rev_8_21_14_0_10_39_11]